MTWAFSAQRCKPLLPPLLPRPRTRTAHQTATATAHPRPAAPPHLAQTQTPLPAQSLHHRNPAVARQMSGQPIPTPMATQCQMPSLPGLPARWSGTPGTPEQMRMSEGREQLRQAATAPTEAETAAPAIVTALLSAETGLDARRRGTTTGALIGALTGRMTGTTGTASTAGQRGQSGTTGMTGTGPPAGQLHPAAGHADDLLCTVCFCALVVIWPAADTVCLAVAAYIVAWFLQPECLLPTPVMQLAFVKPMPNMDTLLHMTLPATAVLHSPHERAAAAV